MATSKSTCASSVVAILTGVVGTCAGCQTSHPFPVGTVQRDALQSMTPVAVAEGQPTISLVSHESDGSAAETKLDAEQRDGQWRIVETLSEQESLALHNNPTLKRMQQEAAAAWDKTRYIGKLPDPSVGGTFFIPPMNFEPDRQVAELRIMQMIPWLGRLDAEVQQACLEAMAAENLYHAERLRVIGDLRAAWFKLYVVGKQIETAVREQEQVQALITTANSRVATGNAEPGDVLMATLELSSLEEQLVSYRQQIVATSAEMNRLMGRTSGAAIQPPNSIDAALPDWNHEMLVAVAFKSQPEITAARLRTCASRWGIEVARLKRRPDITLEAGWVVMDAPGATMSGAGRDSFMLGVSTTLPVSTQKYDAMASEASRQHCAAHASEEEVTIRLSTMLRELWEQARASRATVELYEKSTLPLARQTFEADQKSLINNTVTFDRVVRDYRNLLTSELGYHRALGELATALARIRQAVGVDLLSGTVGQSE